MRILVLGTVRPAHHRLKEMGHEIILFIEKRSAKPIDVNEIYEQVCILPNDAEPDIWLKHAKIVHETQPLDAVCSFHDNCQPHAICIADSLGLYFPVDLETVKLVANKFDTRKRLSEYNLNTVDCYRAENALELTSLIDTLVSYPYIIKPIAGTASFGVHRVNQAIDIHALVKHYISNAKYFPVIVEQFVEGPEYSVEGFSTDGAFHMLAITQKFKDGETFVEQGHAIPADADDELSDKIYTYLSQTLGALGIMNGPTHNEIIVSDNTVHLIETHTRVGGDCIPDLVKHATQIDLYELIGRQACGENISLEKDIYKNTKSASAIWYKLPNFTGPHLIVDTPCITHCTSDNITSQVLLKQTGDTTGPLTNSFDRLMYAIAKAATAKDAVSIARKHIDSVSFSTSVVEG